MPDFDAHIHAFQDDLTKRASLDWINRAKEHWRAYVQGSAESELMRNKMAILLSEWQAEDRAMRLSTIVRPASHANCGKSDLAH